jgi:Ni,Fe-hydrogenase III large subunit
MLGAAMYTTIKTLRELGKNKSEIARLTGHDWKTVSKVIKGIRDGREASEMKERQSMVEPFKEKVVKLLEIGLSGVR